MKRTDSAFHRAAEIALVVFELAAIVALSVVAAFLIVAIAAALAPPAAAAVDDFGRPWSATAVWSTCPAADQFAGLQFVQHRAGLPGSWVEGRVGRDAATGAGGIAVRLLPGLSARAGAAVTRAGDDLTVRPAAGLTASWRRLAFSAGWDGGTDAASIGAGITFWRPAEPGRRIARRRRTGRSARAPVAYCDRCQQPVEPDDLTDRGDLGRICAGCEDAVELAAYCDDDDDDRDEQ